MTIPFLAGAFGRPAGEVRLALGTIHPARSVATVRAHVTGFLEHHLCAGGRRAA